MKIVTCSINSESTQFLLVPSFTPTQSDMVHLWPELF